MKRYYCDGGSIMIGTKESRVCFPNGYGDGDFEVRVINPNDSTDKLYMSEDKWDWIGTVEGDGFNVYDYDCLHDEDLEDKEHILFHLSGRYGVYRRKGEIALEKWRD